MINKPPIVEDSYFDMDNHLSYVWYDDRWHKRNDIDQEFEEEPVVAPTTAELEKYPALKEAWDAYLIIRHLVGLK